MILNNGRCSPTFLEVLVFAISAVLILDDACRVRHLLDHHVLGKINMNMNININMNRNRNRNMDMDMNMNKHINMNMDTFTPYIQ